MKVGRQAWGERAWLVGIGLAAGASPLTAATIAEVSETNWLTQAGRFLTFSEPVVRYATVGCVMLGIACGLMGCFLLVRKLALLGDTVSHAVLPGVALGFLWNMTRDPVAIFIGATIAGLLSTVLSHAIRQTTKLKEDAALGLALGGFYGVGVVLMRLAQNDPAGTKAGLDKFFFGQAAALGPSDVTLIAVVTLLAIGLIALFYKELLATSFDLGFARVLGLPAHFFHLLIMLLLTFAVVVALQAVGVVLVSALLITPAATAYLLTQRLPWMLVFAAVLGALAGYIGAFASYLDTGLPTGPFIVLAATVCFGGAFFFAPQQGLVPRWWLRLRRSRRIQLENTLKAIFQTREKADFAPEGVALGELASRRSVPVADAIAEVKRLVRAGYATLEPPQPGRLPQLRTIYPTPVGWEVACRVVRNHRLWELYLTRAVDFPPDHVHEDAEVIEHVLGADTVRALERRLDFPSRDPHGKLIPSVHDLARNGVTAPV